MVRLTFLVATMLFAGCVRDDAPRADTSDRPTRIVSLDYCADQYLLKLVDKDRILAVSPDAEKQFSYMRETANGVATVKPLAENVLALKPDLVVRSYGGGPGAAAFFERAGVRVLNVGWTTSVDGDGPGSVTHVVSEMAKGLGEQERGDELMASFRARLSALNAEQKDLSALYITSGGATTGPGSFVHQLLLAAGLDNFERTSGWRALPLERLAYEQPDVVAAAFFSTSMNDAAPWSAARHPLIGELMKDRETVAIEGAWTACGAWFVMDAIETLAAAGAERRS